MISKLAIDASVVLKWFPFGDEKLVKEAQDIWRAIRLGRVQVYAPLFLLVEVMNVLARKKKIKEVTLKKILNELIGSTIKFVSLEMTDLEQLTTLVARYGLTAYDAQYLLLAKQLKCKLVTYDEELLKVRDLAVEVKNTL